jgi:hypothetical protein
MVIDTFESRSQHAVDADADDPREETIRRIDDDDHDDDVPDHRCCGLVFEPFRDVVVVSLLLLLLLLLLQPKVELVLVVLVDVISMTNLLSDRHQHGGRGPNQDKLEQSGTTIPGS